MGILGCGICGTWAVWVGWGWFMLGHEAYLNLENVGVFSMLGYGDFEP